MEADKVTDQWKYTLYSTTLHLL